MHGRGSKTVVGGGPRSTTEVTASWRRPLNGALALSLAVGAVVALPATPAAAETNTLSLDVFSARTEERAPNGPVTKGDPITEYKFLINEDNTGTTVARSPAPGTGCSPQDPGYPGSCDWISIKGQPAPSPVYTSGDQDDLAAGLHLPDGRYLISVLADGYKIDGAHFTVPLPGNGTVKVALQPQPLPDSTLRAQVFADTAFPNGTLDASEVGLAGFVGHATDTLGEIQSDVYGNPLCTTYVGEDVDNNPDTIDSYEIDPTELDPPITGTPVVDKVGGECVSDANGMLVIPHLGPNRYAMTATPPDGQSWAQTTTLEGNLDWDAWQMEGATGFDTEFVLAGEPVPPVLFGFVPPTNDLAGGTGSVKGVVVGIHNYTPPTGGDFNLWGLGLTGTKVDEPIKRPWIALSDLQDSDSVVYSGRGTVDGTFNITGVPNGNYVLSWWDKDKNYFINFVQVTVDGGVANIGTLPLNGWWTEYDGYVFNDKNRNGVKDPNEPGVANYTLTLRRRENTLMDRGTTTVTTDNNGYYEFKSAYPLNEWVVMEAYSDNFYTTGVTYQADNQTEPTTDLGAGVDVSVLPVIGLSGQMDWGVHHYNATGANGIDPRNGGIVGTVTYDTTRNELDPQFAATEDWSPGIAGLPVNLYAPLDCPVDGPTAEVPCDSSETYQVDPDDGSYVKGPLLNSTTTESWSRPTGCTARNVDGDPLVHGVDENVLATNQETDGECLETFLQSVQFGTYPTDQDQPDIANFGAAVDGNYGFGDGCFNGTLDATDPEDIVCVGGDFTALPAADYLVEVAVPDDQAGLHPLYKPTREEDINIGNGNQIIPQVPPPACAGPLHTVDVAGIDAQGDLEFLDNGDPNPDFDGDGANPTQNQTFVDIGGSPYEGTDQPLCDTKLVELNNGKSIVPIFSFFTDVPLPSRMRGLLVDDLNFSTDPRSTSYGEKKGIPFAPVGIYDWADRLVYTVESDYNGLYDVLMPSTDHISCPTPTGICAGMYRFMGNDPGVPGALNPNYNPNYRTIAAEFEAWPGMIIPTDLAPTQVGVQIENPTTGTTQVQCTLDGATPQLYAVSQPYVSGSGSFTIDGLGFGASAGEVTLDGPGGEVILASGAWSNTQIGATVPGGTAAGPYQLKITGSNGQSTVNGLTFHVLGDGYNPDLYEVGPGKTYSKIQDAVDAAEGAAGNDLVVVYPGVPDFDNPRNNPRGAYYENVIMTQPVKLQGVGPGGFQGNTFVPGSIMDGGAFAGDTQLATDWYNKVGDLTWDGNQAVNDGEVVYILTEDGTFTSTYKASIDGFDIRGGAEGGFPGNINDLTGENTGLPPNITTQGGAIFANAYARHLQITNNVVQNNGSGYGTIRIGTPDLPGADTDQENDNVRIANNRIFSNAGTNLAGGIGIYAGADNYEVSGNDICGNFSVEYGGGMTVYGKSPNGKIHHNRVYLNNSYDEGGGVMITGQLPTVGDLSPGTGRVDIYANQIQGNLANDDGGGLRFLMAGDYPINVYNNTIVNNVSTHEGGGIGINDAPDLRIYNNTIMKNLTTATALTSNGQPAPAGLSTSANSDQLQETLPGGASTFSNPRLFNNIFWDNRAGTRAGPTVSGLGLPNTGSIERWDMGVADGTGVLAPTNSVVQGNNGGHPWSNPGTSGNIGANPDVISTFDLTVSFATWRQNPMFVGSTLVTTELPPDQMGDYHLDAGSPAIDLGAATSGGVNAPDQDIDGDYRPNGPRVDSGSDEIAGGSPPVCLSPTVSALNVAPNPTLGSTSVALTATANAVDALNPATEAQYWVDGGAPLPMTLVGSDLSATIDVSGLALGTHTVSVQARGACGAWGPVSTIDFTVSPAPPTSPVLYFSTRGNGMVPGVPRPWDNSDIYGWNQTSFTRELTAQTVGVPASANVDGYSRVDATHYYMSFSGTTVLPVLGSVRDEDVVYYNNGSWSMYFDGSTHGMARRGRDLDAISVVGGVLYFSTVGNSGPPGVGGQRDNADIYSWNGTSYARVWDATDNGVPASANVDGLSFKTTSDFYVSFSADTSVPGLGAVQDEDVVRDQAGVWSVFFDGTSHGLTTSARDVDAFDVP